MQDLRNEKCFCATCMREACSMRHFVNRNSRELLFGCTSTQVFFKPGCSECYICSGRNGQEHFGANFVAVNNNDSEQLWDRLFLHVINGSRVLVYVIANILQEDNPHARPLTNKLQLLHGQLTCMLEKKKKIPPQVPSSKASHKRHKKIAAMKSRGMQHSPMEQNYFSS